MIALLKGTVEQRFDPYIVIDVNGVGYKVLATAGVLSSIHLGQQVTVHIYTHVREDALELYGFQNAQDLKLFEQLISVSGVGPKTAIGIFSIGTSSELINAITQGNVEFFTAVPRLGKKNAQKIIIELKSKVGSTGDLDLSQGDGQASGEVVAALKSFGFSTKEAHDAIRSLNGQGETTEDKVRLALKYLGR
ncbi:MAG: Holliday junction branch migration protein RuvA [Candidatus Levybacteria bacterium]|nr:Holliday junction branch migration protein RuvA [Candidatus Levybacteria bacterium]